MRNTSGVGRNGVALTKRQRGLLRDLEDNILAVLYPNLTAGQHRAMRSFMAKKGASLIDLEQVYKAADALLGSVIRHRDTHYEELLYVHNVEREKARGMVDAVVQKRLLEAKGWTGRKA